MQIYAYIPFESYTYSTATGSPRIVYSSAPYVPEKIINSASLSSDLSEPVDICFDKNGRMFITDKAQNAILILNQDEHLEKVIKEFRFNGKTDGFASPEGMFVSDLNKIYICDTENSRIVVLNDKYECEKIIGAPTSAVLGENYIFKPRKMAVDAGGSLYVINANEYNGIMKLSPEGSFVSFLGSNKATVDLAELFWKQIMTSKQKAKLVKFIPSEYFNISMDLDGFLFVVSQSKTESVPLKRLNLNGDDVLIRGGYVDVTGDVTARQEERSVFADVTSDENGFYYAIDSANGRIFTYNSDGYLFYVFGGKGDKIGCFSSPNAIENKDGKLYVADSENGTITVFKRTDYGNLLSLADTTYEKGDYEQSVKLWHEVIRNNANFDLAYAQIGKVLLRQGRYNDAMRYFELGNYRGDTATGITGYNKAFIEFRKVMASKYLGYIFVGAAIFIVVYYIRKHLLKKRGGKSEK